MNKSCGRICDIWAVEEHLRNGNSKYGDFMLAACLSISCNVGHGGRDHIIYCTYYIYPLREMSPPKRVQISMIEGNILLAVSAFQSGQFTSIFAAANAYNVCHKTLYRRVKGGTSREDYILMNERLN